MALVNRAQVDVGIDLGVHVVGALRFAKVIVPSPYDPTGKAMRV